MKKVFNFIKKSVVLLCKGVILVLVGIYLYFLAVNLTANKYNGPQYEADLYQMVDDYATAYCKKNNTQLIDVGDFTNPSKHLWFGVWLTCGDAEDLQRGRTRAIAFVKDFSSTLQQSKVANEYFQQSKRNHRSETVDSINPNLFGVKIAYWDKNVNRPQPPYLAEVTYCRGTFYYYQADPKTQALNLIFKESYEDAIKETDG